MLNLELEKNINLISLYDRYKNMLTNKQQEYFEYYYFENFTLQEIANEFKITRSAIYDSLIKTQQILENLELKLHIQSNFKKIQSLINKFLEENKKNKYIEKILEVIS